MLLPCFVTDNQLLPSTHTQENSFFDGPNSELNSKRVVVRVRLYNKDQKATLTVKVRFVFSASD